MAGSSSATWLLEVGAVRILEPWSLRILDFLCRQALTPKKILHLA